MFKIFPHVFSIKITEVVHNFWYTKFSKSVVCFILRVHLNSTTLFSLEILDVYFIFHKIYMDTHTPVVPNRLRVSQ